VFGNRYVHLSFFKTLQLHFFTIGSSSIYRCDINDSICNFKMSNVVAYIRFLHFKNKIIIILDNSILIDHFLIF
jgi:hypothetical protein